MSHFCVFKAVLELKGACGQCVCRHPLGFVQFSYQPFIVVSPTAKLTAIISSDPLSLNLSKVLSFVVTEIIVFLYSYFIGTRICTYNPNTTDITWFLDKHNCPLQSSRLSFWEQKWCTGELQRLLVADCAVGNRQHAHRRDREPGYLASWFSRGWLREL